MAIKITKSTERITVETTTIMLYGPPGIGKTSAGCTSESPLLLDFDKGSHRTAFRKDVVRVESWATVAAMNAEDLADYKTIVVDTVGRCLDMMAADIIRKNPKMQGFGGALTQQGYGALKGAFATWIGWLTSLGKDIVLIAHDKEDKKGDELIYRADIQGSSHGEVFKRADGVAYMHTVGRDTVLDFSPTDRWLGKNPARFEPLVVPDFQERRDFLATVIADTKAAMNRMSEEQQKVVAEIDSWNTRATEATCAEEINALVAEAVKLPAPVGPQAKHIVAARAKELALTFDKKAKLYVDPDAQAVAQ